MPSSELYSSCVSASLPPETSIFDSTALFHALLALVVRDCIVVDF